MIDPILCAPCLAAEDATVAFVAVWLCIWVIATGGTYNYFYNRRWRS